MAAPTAQPEPVSAPDPLRVVFDPPLYLQRQGAIHTLVTRAANTPRFANSIHSLLDAGCGEAQLLRRLTPCDDYLPLTQLTGIDLSNDIWDPSLSETLAPGGYFGTGRPDERWRPVNVSLLHGSFEALSMDRVGRHDVIVSTEVIEHLDPGPLENYAPTLLGKMRPKIFIVTTPNRDFNALFDYLDPPPERESDTTGFYRPEIPYRMRHHDHRFEWSRKEFSAWAIDAAARFGYDVAFSGVGGMGRGLSVVGGSDSDGKMQILKAAAVSNEKSTSGTDLPAIDEIVCAWEALRELVKDEGDAMTDWGAHVRRVFGDCSQIAVFVIKESASEEGATRVPGSLDEWSDRLHNITADLQIVAHYHHLHNPAEEFPPTFPKALEALMDRRLADLVPRLVRDEWNKSPVLLAREARDRFRGNATIFKKECIVSNDSLDLGDYMAQYEEEERRKLNGMEPYNIELVEVAVDIGTLWDESVPLQRLCRFRYEVFRDMMLRPSIPSEEQPFDLQLKPGERKLVLGNIDPTTPKYRDVFMVEITPTEDLSRKSIKLTFPEIKAEQELKPDCNCPVDTDELMHDEVDLACESRLEPLQLIPENVGYKAPEMQEQAKIQLHELEGEDYWAMWSDAGSCDSTASELCQSIESLNKFQSPSKWHTEIEWLLADSEGPGNASEEPFQKHLDASSGERGTLQYEKRRDPKAACIKIRFWRPQHEGFVLDDDQCEPPGNFSAWDDEYAPDGWGEPGP